MSWLESLPSFSLEEAEDAFARKSLFRRFDEAQHPRSHGRFRSKGIVRPPSVRRAPRVPSVRPGPPSPEQGGGPAKDFETPRQVRSRAEPTELKIASGKKLPKPDANGIYDVGRDVNMAADLLAQGQHVRLESPKEASMLLNKLAATVQEMKEKGDKAPDFDLCKITVPGTNLFCAESKGIPRIQMPQLGGTPLPGSKGDKLPKNEAGGIDLTELFRKHLIKKGFAVEDGTEPASHMKATQIELNGAKVAAMTKVLDSGKPLLGDPRIFVSEDDYIVDGHHRWAANIGHDLEDGRLGDVTMPVRRVKMGIIPLLAEANNFAEEWGIPRAGVGQMDGKLK